MTQSVAPVWFVTGCSTGFGRALVVLLLEQGFRVVATARNVTTVAPLVAAHGDHALALSLDITDAAAIADAVAAAHTAFGQIDVLVNNAGYGYLAAIEEGEDATIRRMFDTNVFGLAQMIRAVLPGMRARRRGHIVNMSSIAGLVNFAGTGYYQATKFAVEGISGALALEVNPLNIRVTSVAPGPFRTDFGGRSIAVAGEQIADYAETAGASRIRNLAGSGKQPGDPARGAQAIIDVVASDDPPLHLLLGRPALELARNSLEAKARLFETWAGVSLGADFPQG